MSSVGSSTNITVPQYSDGVPDNLGHLLGRGLGGGQGEQEEVVPLLGVAHVDQLVLHHQA